METGTERMRRLERRCAGLIIAVVILLIAFIGSAGALWLSSTADHLMYTLSVNWQPDGGLHFTAPSDGPFIVMYLEHGFNTGEVRTARLPQSIVITDSFGAGMSKEKVQQLKWRDVYGKPIAAPKEGSDIKAFYFRPSVAVQ
jgi:hypothetical protein